MDDTQRIVKCGNLSLHSTGGFFKVSFIRSCALSANPNQPNTDIAHQFVRPTETMARQVLGAIRWQQVGHQATRTIRLGNQIQEAEPGQDNSARRLRPSGHLSAPQDDVHVRGEYRRASGGLSKWLSTMIISAIHWPIRESIEGGFCLIQVPISFGLLSAQFGGQSMGSCCASFHAKHWRLASKFNCEQ